MCERSVNLKSSFIGKSGKMTGKTYITVILTTCKNEFLQTHTNTQIDLPGRGSGSSVDIPCSTVLGCGSVEPCSMGRQTGKQVFVFSGESFFTKN